VKKELELKTLGPKNSQNANIRNTKTKGELNSKREKGNGPAII
jgi:hypothetical protein